MNPTALRSLADRLEQATGRDWKLDDSIQIAFDTFDISNPTDSIGSALALVERLLPGWGWRVGSHDDDHSQEWAWADVLPPQWDGSDDPPYADAHAPTPALAILLALVTALIAKAEG